MDVSTVSFEDRSTPQVTTPDRKADIDQRKRESHQWGRDSKHAAVVLAPDEPKAAKHEADG
jgi:hypothetical protein